MEVGVILPTFGVVCASILISWLLNWIWLKPKKLEKYLREQGLKGTPYKLFYGDTKDMMSSTIQAMLSPMEFSHQIVPRVMPFLHHNIQNYGKLSYCWFGPVPQLTIMDPDMVKEVLSNRLGHIGKPKSEHLAKYLIAGLVGYEGQKWAKHRKIINPAFHLEKLKMMLPAFEICCTEMVNKWHKLVQEESGELDVWPHLRNLTADTISRTAFGSSYEEGRQIFQLQTEQAKLVMASLQSICIPGFEFLPTKRNKRIKENHNEIGIIIRNLIRKREMAMTNGEVLNTDLLGLLMESNLKEIKEGGNVKNVGMNTDEIIEECRLFYFAGQESTATLLVWTMILLSMHQNWQKKAREEVFQLFGRGKIDFDGLNRLKLVTMILHEVLRIYPAAVLLVRATNEKIKLGDITVPPGVELAIPLLLIHHDHELWGEDADEFNPERFSEGISKATKNRVSYIPFSWGPRVCIGQNFALIEAKIAIAMILQNFSFELSPTYAHAPCTIPHLQPQHGAPLILRKL